MKYVIYEMIQLDHLRDFVNEGYGYKKTIYRDVLEKLDVDKVQSEHLTVESAIEEIQKNKDRLKSLRLTILPVISISWDGEVS